jgi:4-amino-4-deoxy-L-arabinose transferase-like glycosyltransferase
MNRNFIKFLKEYWGIIAILLLSIALRLLWLHMAPHGDEGEAGYTSMLWSQGYLPYVSREDGKPPLLYLLYLLFGSSVISIRIINLILFMVSIWALYGIADIWFGKKIGILSSLIFAIFMNVPVIEGIFALPSSLSLSLFIIAIYLLLIGIRSHTLSSYVYTSLSGFFISASCIMYQQRVVGFILIICIILISYHYSKRTQRINFRSFVIIRSLFIVIGAVIPILGFLVYFGINGAIKELIQNTILNIFFGTSYRFVGNQTIPFDWTYLTILEALPLLILSTYGIVHSCIRRMNTDAYVFVWLLISMLSLILEPRHFGHYTQLIIPVAAIFSGIALNILLEINDNINILSSKVFIGLFILVSLLPSVYFQSLQYPDFTIEWTKNFKNVFQSQITWVENSGIGKYDTQMKLISDLKSLNIEDEKLLVTGWSPQVYWLTGIRAPSPNLCTVAEWSPLTQDEYNNFVDLVTTKKLNYVLITGNAPRDEIYEATIRNYSLLNTFGNAQLFGKYDIYGRYSSFNFIEKFDEAIKEYDISNGVKGNTDSLTDNTVIPDAETQTINGITKISIRQHPFMSSPPINSYIKYKDVQVLENSTLDFSIAIGDGAWDQIGDGVQFNIIVTYNDNSDEIFAEYIDPKHNADQRKWNNYNISLASYTDKKINITFVTNAGDKGDANYDWAFWGDPHIISEKTD